MFDVLEIRKEFPILAKKVNDKPLVYLDNGASSQKPMSVIETVKNCYENEYSNVHRGLHFLSNLATEKFEAVREKIRSFLGATHLEEIIFTSGSTEALNLVSYAWAGFGAAFGPAIVLSLYWSRMNRNGALAGILVGGITIVAWKQLEGGWFDVYEIVPGIIFSSLIVYRLSPSKVSTFVFIF